MKDLMELFWTASVEELKRGYICDDKQEEYICLICGERFQKGVIYEKDHIYYEAEKFTRLHIVDRHSSMFEYLINMDKKWTGLTDLQKKLLHYFYLGYSDKEIVKELDGGSTSTIRNHRFTLREKMKQAKIFLALMELLEEKNRLPSRFIHVPRSVTRFDQRYAITEQENREILAAYFKEGLDGPLFEFPKKEKRKIAILNHLAKKFEPNRKYTEAEVNAILKKVYPDYVTLRRYLIEYGFMDRTPDGSNYWIKI
ncbi:MAG: DUF2087 domain-containing protein [Thermoactinomyces sp.]